MKAYVLRRGILVFYIEGSDDITDPTIANQLDLIKQLLSTIGKSISIKKTVFCLLKEDFCGNEKKILTEIVQLFQLLWQELETIQEKIQINLQQEAQF